MASVSNGEFSLITPFVYCQKYSQAALGLVSMQQRLNSSYGYTLLRAYFGIFHGTETNATVYIHNDSYFSDYNTYDGFCPPIDQSAAVEVFGRSPTKH